MLYKDFINAGVTIGEIEIIQTIVEMLGYELEEYLETLAIVDSNEIYKAIGFNAIIDFLKQYDIKILKIEDKSLKDLYAKAVA